MPGETDREWGEPIVMDKAVQQRVDDLWDELGISPRQDQFRDIQVHPYGHQRTGFMKKRHRTVVCASGSACGVESFQFAK